MQGCPEPEPRSWTIIVPADATQSSREEIQPGVDDSIRGWDLAWSVEAGASARPELALRVSDRWRGNAPLAYTGIRLARGGRLLVPWPFLDIRIDDPSSVASTVHVVAYPWRGEWSCSGSLAYGIDRASVDAGRWILDPSAPDPGPAADWRIVPPAAASNGGAADGAIQVINHNLAALNVAVAWRYDLAGGLQ